MKAPSIPELVAEGLSLLRQSPEHDLPRWFRRRVLLTLGPPGSQEGHTRRVELAIRSTEKVMPIWAPVFGPDDTPRCAIALARGVMAGAVRAEEAMRQVDRHSTRLDDLAHGLNRVDRAVMVGQAAIAAAIGAVDDLEFGCGEEAQSVSDEDLQPGGDSFMAAAAAWSDGFPWLGTGDTGRRLEFWKWWLATAQVLAAGHGA